MVHLPRASLVLLLVGTTISLPGQSDIPSPKEEFGFALGDDYCLATYTQLQSHWKKLESTSDRVALEVIGKTEEGRDLLMAIITSRRNHARLPRLREISRRLALAEGVDEALARALAREGCAVVWIDGGLHASEVLVAQQLMETVYQLAERRDPWVESILDNVVVLCSNPNPDGQELVANWYMREEDPKKRSTSHLPRLYQKYTGHDNNRDFYMITQKETEALCRVFFHEWFPQIIYNHHQTAPSGTVMFAPPFRDPFNHNFDPLVPIGIDFVGAAMHQRFLVEGKPGTTMRKGASYSTWWNGGLRTVAYFHNMIGLLTETIGHPTPIKIPLRLERQLAHGDLPSPIVPQEWHFRRSIEYSLTANWAVLDIASKHREDFLYNIYRMGRNSIDRGSRDHWTIRPDTIARAQTLERTAKRKDSETSQGDDPESNREESETEQAKPKGPDIFAKVFRDPATRDPRAYVIPADQPDFPTAIEFANTLIKSGVRVHRAAEPFSVQGTSYAEGSLIVRCDQAFRPHILDMFEPQVHPDDIPSAGGAPIPPYDSAGWTLAFQMGVKFDRILAAIEGPFEPAVGLLSTPKGAVTAAEGAVGFLASNGKNVMFSAVQRLLKHGENLHWLARDVDVCGTRWPAGTFWIPRTAATEERLVDVARDLGLIFQGVSENPKGPTIPLRRARVGLWDQYGGSMASGWTRWILERFEVDFRLVYPQELDAGQLAANFDVLIFPSGAIPPVPKKGSKNPTGRRGRGPKPESIPPEFRSHLGRVTAEKTIPRLREFLKDGGSIVAVGSSTNLAHHLDLPVRNAFTEFQIDGTEVPLPREKYFIPGSLLEATLDTTHPLAFGCQSTLDVVFRQSPSFRVGPGARARGITPVGWFDSRRPLRSGWAWGQHYLADSACILEVELGKGSLFLLGPEVTFRAQPHASFKLLFNALLWGPARARGTLSGSTEVPQDGQRD